MTIGAIVQARMSSERLPGKVLMPLAGKPMLQYLLESLQHAKAVDRVILATSDRIEDDAVACFCEESGHTCFRGDLKDVAGRLLEAAGAYSLDFIVRISGDSPLLDWRLVDRAAALAADHSVDLVTNVFPRSFPKGQSVEVISVKALRRAHELMTHTDDKEHVTRYLYNHPTQFRILNFDSGERWGDLTLCVDTAEDFNRLEALIKRLDGPPWQYSVEELVALVAEEPARAL